MNAPSRAALHVTEQVFSSFDGTELFYRAWHPGTPQTRALALFHGGHEHSGRFDELARKLIRPDVSVFAWDARGHGRSPGKRGYARHFMDFVRDAEAFIVHLDQAYGIRRDEIVVLGHSVGSVVLSTWLLDYAPPVRGAVLGSPAFHVKLYLPFALPALRLWRQLRPDSYVNSYVRPGMLTHDEEEARSRRMDPLISPKIAVRVLTSLFDTADRVTTNAPQVHAPVLILSAGSDWVVHQRAQRRFFDRLGSARKDLITFEGFYHEIFHEKDRERAIRAARAFVDECFETSPADTTEAPAEANRERLEQLRRPLPLLHPKRLGFAVARALLSTVGRLSEGIRIGWARGFDSGSMLDYVYANRAKGITPLGRLIDRVYLDSTGWAGIRQRGANLQSALLDAIRRLRTLGKDVHIMDVAAGPGRYLLHVLDTANDSHVSALCRDRDEAGLAEGRELARARGAKRIAYETGDAFDPRSLATVSPRPNIVVISGLYELFEDNELVLTSLKGIHEALEEGGVILYTNQPHHPQLEFIARTLVNRDGDPWIMRLRPQAEMNALARAAGFLPECMAIDDSGIFTVTTARRPSEAAAPSGSCQADELRRPS